MDKKKPIPQKITFRGKSAGSLIKALSKFPPNTPVTVRREWRSSYDPRYVFTVYYDSYLKRLNVVEIY